MSLGARLALILGALMAASTLLTSLLLGEIAGTRAEAESRRRLGDVALQMQDKLDRGMFERWRDIQVAAALDPLFLDGASAQRRRVVLDRLQATFPSYAWISFTDPAGLVLAATGGLLEGQSVAQRPWFQAARKGPHAGDVHEAKLLQNLLAPPGAEPLRFVDVAAPVRGPDGALVGIIGAHLSWRWAEEIEDSVLSATGRADGIELLVLSENGTVLLGPPDTLGQTLAVQPDNGARPVAGAPWIDSHLVALAHTTGYRDYPGLGWWVLARQPRGPALAAAATLRETLLLAGGLVTLVAVLVGFATARAVVRPLSQLIRAVAGFRIDGETTLPPVRGYAEVRSLAQTLTNVFATVRAQADDLRRANRELEDRVAERTRVSEDR